MKPPLPYFGGKQRIADQIVALLPEHMHYVEPFAGGLSVFLAKPPSKIETLNDLDRDIMTFWRILRERPGDLMTAATLTPHSRAELAYARRRDDSPDDLETARRVWVELTQGRASKGGSSGWRFCRDGTSMPFAGYLAGYVRRMPAAAARLADVSLECRPALDVIREYGCHESTLLYVDPPYLGSTRGSVGYRHEMTGDAEHAELLAKLRECRARVALSGYASDLYADALSDWHSTRIAASTSQMADRAKSGRVEIVWTNYEPVPHLFSDAS